MKLAFFVTSITDPAAKHRVLDFLPSLQEEGHSCEVREIPKETSERQVLFRSAADSDVVFLQRRLMNFWDLRRLRRYAKRLIFDFDDALPFRDSKDGAGIAPTRRRRFSAVVSRVDLVLAGNAYLADLARKAGGERVRVLPTALDAGHFGFRGGRRIEGENEASARDFRIGWIGSRSTLPYLEALAEPLSRASQDHPSIRLVVMADRPPQMEGVRTEFIPWASDREVGFLHSLDLGLAPLSDDPWSRGKCGLRLLKFFSCGIPALASSVGVQGEMVQEGKTGFLVEPGDDWGKRLSSLLESPDQLASVTQAARKVVEEQFATQEVSRSLSGLLSGSAGD